MDRTQQERLHRLAAAARASKDMAAADREALHAEIEAAEVAGESTREIARHVDMSPSWVHDVVIARTAARQARLARTVGR